MTLTQFYVYWLHKHHTLLKITFLGTGTSQGIPVIACSCGVCISKDKKDQRWRSSVMIQMDNTHIVIDCGPDFRQQMLSHQVRQVDAVLCTHEHKDHLGGLDDTRPISFAHNKDMPIYATAQVIKAIQREYHYAFGPNKYPGVPALKLIEIKASEDFFVEDYRVTPIQVTHAQMPVLGFRIGSFTYITDANAIDQKEKQKILGTKILVLNALRREKHISHFTLEEAIILANEIGAEQTFFTHISHQLGKHEDVQKELPKNMFLAYDGLQLDL